MPSFINCLLLVALLVATVIAVPQPVPSYQRKGRSFKVERRANPSFVKRDGPKAYLKALRKYAMPIPPHLIEIENKKKHGKTNGNGSNAGTGSSTSSANTAVASSSSNTTTAATNATGAASGSVVTTPEAQDVEYLSEVTIGGQTMLMDFDSGSSDLWVFSTSLNTASQTGHTLFNPTKSTTFKAMTGAKFSISYGDGSGAAGSVGTDTVNIGGVTVTNQAVEVATAVSSSFVQDTQSNGLVGLAFSSINTVTPTKQKTFLDNAQSSLAQPLFTANLKHATAGSYEFGAIDATQFTGAMQWSAINNTNGFWQFTSSQVQVGTGAATSTGSVNQAIADTGTTLMIASPDVINAYYSQVTGAVEDQSAGGVVFPCSSTLPDLSFDVGGNFMATVKGEFINFTNVDNTNCFGGLQASTSDLMIFGDVMFKSNLVAFNIGNNSLGFAQHA